MDASSAGSTRLVLRSIPISSSFNSKSNSSVHRDHVIAISGFDRWTGRDEGGEAGGSLRRRSHGRLHRLLSCQKWGGVDHGCGDIRRHLHRLQQGWWLPRLRLVQWRPRLHPHPCHLSPPPSLSLLLDDPNAYSYRPLDTLPVPLLPVGSSSTSTSVGASPLFLPWVDDATTKPSRMIGIVETTAQVHTQLFTWTLLAIAVAEHGVEVVIGEAERVELEGGRAVAVVLKEGGWAIAADAVVLALGPWSNRFPLVSSLFNIYGHKAHSILCSPQFWLNSIP